MENKKPSLLRSLGTALAVVVGIVVFAYGVQVTDVNFETTQSENRLTQLRRVIRALVRPDIVEYETIDTDTEIPFYLPCPEGVTLEEPQIDDPNQPYLTASAYCADVYDLIQVKGYNFAPYSRGPLNFITASGVKKQLGNFETDGNGFFEMEVEIPKRQPVEEAQHIRATARVRVGNPMLTLTAKVTWEKIIETVFMALLATAIGTAAAIPISFIAARNLMAENKSPLSSIALSIIGWPAGIYLGLKISSYIRDLMAVFIENTTLAVAALVVSAVLILVLLRFSIRPEETDEPSKTLKMVRSILMAIAGLLGIVFLVFLESVLKTVGLSLIEPLKGFGFLGNFFYQIGEAGYLIIPAASALGFGSVVGSMLGGLGQRISDKSPAAVVKIINLIAMTLAGALLFVLVGGAINWFYQINNPIQTVYWPAGIGGAIGLILAIITGPKQALPTGLIIYFVTRTILNATRSVESLVMAIVFVIWVGIGPFAGSLALALHTLAALAKLYSEQVESILPGPLEAVTATGANRLQTIVYAVVPQIVSPYISFTMYRWDINVRMSTIIGFVGGGGIGFLLQQNINLLDYRAASVQMLAIAVVVALMDYISSVVRERMV
jgi:phosphonate ABC transporter permease subunit PhnE